MFVNSNFTVNEEERDVRCMLLEPIDAGTTTMDKEEREEVRRSDDLHQRR
jgi:hypothetical protein